MRVLLFHGQIDALNHYTDSADLFLKKIGCITCVCALPLTEQGKNALEEFLKKRVHAAVLYDGIGMCFKEIYDQLEIPVINILVDHPMTFWHCMDAPPRKYIQFSPDERHIEFAKKYWNIDQSFFLPHMGTAPVIRGGDRPIELLFSGTCWSFEALKEGINQTELGIGFRTVFFDMIDYMLIDSSMTIEDACRIVLRDRGINPSPRDFALIMVQAKEVDEYVRMYYRDRVLREVLDSGIDITVIGVNWDKSDLSGYSNFHWIPPMPFKEVFGYMERSKIVLNVMPWFKAGSHERIFNTLLSGACPLSDRSQWLERNFTDKEDIAFYDLDDLEKLPGMIRELLADEALREKIICKGQEKVVRQYMVPNIIGEVLQKGIALFYPQ